MSAKAAVVYVGRPNPETEGPKSKMAFVMGHHELPILAEQDGSEEIFHVTRETAINWLYWACRTTNWNVYICQKHMRTVDDKFVGFHEISYHIKFTDHSKSNDDLRQNKATTQLIYE